MYTWCMDILQMLTELRAQREQIEEAIMALERLAGGRGKRRGRPPAWLSSGGSSPKLTAKGNRTVRSAAARKAQSLKMKAYWAKRRQAAKK